MDNLKTLLTNFRVNDLFDILLVTFLVYQLLVLIREARAVRLLVGFAVLFLSAVLAGQFHLLTIDWILSSLGPFLLVAFVILFQSDLRRIIAQIGRGGFWGGVFRGDSQAFREISQAARELVKGRRGALIVVERDDTLQGIIETGTPIGAEVSAELLVTFFVPHSPLHDGAVVIRDGRIAAAGCILPLSQNPHLSKHYGTRHRAALGVTEETDALAIVLSEENHVISFAMAGKMTPEIDAATLEEMLTLYGSKAD